MYEGAGQAQEGAHNSNYLKRKTAELAGRLAETEADTEEHAAVLAWGL